MAGAFMVDAEKVRAHVNEVVQGMVEQTRNASAFAFDASPMPHLQVR